MGVGFLLILLVPLVGLIVKMTGLKPTVRASITFCLCLALEIIGLKEFVRPAPGQFFQVFLLMFYLVMFLVGAAIYSTIAKHFD